MNFPFEDNKVRCIPDAAVVAATDKVEAVLVHGEAGHGVQVGHLTIEIKSSLMDDYKLNCTDHAVDHLAGVVVVEADVSVLVAGDGEGQGGVGQHRGDRAHGLAGHGVLVGEG